MIKRICVYCGSSGQVSPSYLAEAAALGRLFAEQQVTLVYGGANVGSMGAMADACLAAGGEVIGVMPKGLEEKEVAHEGLTELHIVADMHQRKAMMADLADAFIALPGGMGTLEELFEALTWAQLEFHGKAIGVLNSEGYFTHLLAFLTHAAAEGFMHERHVGLLLEDSSAPGLLEKLRNYQPQQQSKWW